MASITTRAVKGSALTWAEVDANFNNLNSDILSLAGSTNVKAYGAEGDGSTDDTAAIQAAITAGAGKVVYFPAGSYKVTDTLTVTGSGTVLVGDGPGATTISQRTADIDTVLFKPTTAGTSTDFLNYPGIRGINVTHASVADSATSGAGVRFLQCNVYSLFDCTINDAFEGLTIQGGQFGSLKKFSIFAAAGSYAGADTALLFFRQAPVNASFQACYTVILEDFRLSASLLRETCIYLRNMDGLQAANGYVALGKESLVKIKAERDNSYVASSGFVNTYFDCVNTSSTVNGIDVPTDGYAGSNVYQVKVGSGCVIGNGSGRGIVVRKPETTDINIEGTSILNMSLWAVDVEDVSAGDVHIVNSRFGNNGDATSGAIRVSTARQVLIGSNTFSATETACVTLAGTITQATITGNTNTANVSDLVTTATHTNPLVLSGNSSAYSGANSWRGLRPGNVALSDADTLDWYEEDTFTPTVTFGGGSTGLTYSARAGIYTRIGRVVFFSLQVTLSAKGSSTGALLINALPFTSASTVNMPVSARLNAVTSGVGDTAIYALVFLGSTTCALYKVSAGSQVQLTDADLTDSSVITLSGHYTV